jgi:hypothetical protein
MPSGALPACRQAGNHLSYTPKNQQRAEYHPTLRRILSKRPRKRKIPNKTRKSASAFQKMSIPFEPLPTGLKIGQHFSNRMPKVFRMIWMDKMCEFVHHNGINNKQRRHHQTKCEVEMPFSAA